MPPQTFRIRGPLALGFGIWMQAVVGCATLLDIEKASCGEGLDGCKATDPADDAGSPEEDAAVAADLKLQSLCQDYCGELEKSCTEPGLFQYADEAACNNVCGEYLKLEGSEGPSGDNIACRIGEARSAKSEPSACAAAGLSGNGVCGDICEVYCELMESRCGVKYDEFFDSNSENCEAVCNALDRSPDGFNFGIKTGNNLDCRFWHLQAAAGGGGDSHCGHAAGESFCVDL